MFNKYFYVNDNQAIRDAAAVVAKASKEHDNTLKSISEAEIKSKDRVNIPLEEYEYLKKENTVLRERCTHLEKLFEHIGLDPKVIEKIDLNMVRKWTIEDPRACRSIIRIEFCLNHFDL